MMNASKMLSVVLTIVSTAAFPAFARYLPSWFQNVDEIALRSDLIVIASPVESNPLGTATNMIYGGLDTNDIEVIRFRSNELSFPMGFNAFVPTETTFVILSVLRGAVEGRTFIMAHHTWNRKIFENTTVHLPYSPHLVSFDDLAKASNGDDLHPRFLLFLKSAKKSRFRATTGYVDPAYSVQLLSPIEWDPFEREQRLSRAPESDN